MKNNIYWVWLAALAGPGSTLPRLLINHFGTDIEKIYNADDSEYKEAGLTPKRIATLRDKSLDLASQIVDWCNANKVKILTYEDIRYPNRLRSIPDWPAVLYYIGDLYDIDNELCVATVGTRRMTKYGHDTAYSFSYDLARAGAVVVSGLAAGIDTTCHRAALDSGGKTIAVIGTRINKVYPSENRDIMREIAKKCLLITEYHPFFETQAKNFPIRNRLISGLCNAVIVFEADKNSGSLITADYARKQDRRIFALPGKIGEEGSLGTNELIRDGSTMITRPLDIIQEYSNEYSLQYSDNRIFDYSPKKAKKDSFKKKQKEEIIPITDQLQKTIYGMLDTATPVYVEQLSLPGYQYSEIITAITMLELNGYVVSHPGNAYTKK